MNNITLFYCYNIVKSVVSTNNANLAIKVLTIMLSHGQKAIYLNLALHLSEQSHLVSCFFI